MPAPETPGISPALQKRLRDTLLQLSIRARRAGLLPACHQPGRAVQLPQPAAGHGRPTPEVPPHLRKAVIQRDQHCQFPGCAQPPRSARSTTSSPRSKGGPTALGNLRLLCRFHRLVVIHRWGWKLTCHPGGTTTTATAPDGRVLHSHGPPTRAV
jgi:hypothetical protein